MNYELAKQLKEAGFPQEYRKTNIAMDWIYDDSGKLIMIHDDNDTDWWLGQDYTVTFTEELLKKEYIKCPTLSELIEACGDKINCIWKPNKIWISGIMEYESFLQKSGEGSTPEEAVAKLWLAINKK